MQTSLDEQERTLSRNGFVQLIEHVRIRRPLISSWAYDRWAMDDRLHSAPQLPRRRPVTGRIYLYLFVAEFIPIAPLYVVMFTRESMTTLEISVLVSSWSLTALLLEVPSGVLADRHDRRFVLAAGQLSTCTCFLVWLAAPNFWGYFVGFALWGLGGALHSGTFEALVYDELKSQGVEDRYVAVLGRGEAVLLVAVVLSSALSAGIVADGYHLVLVISALVCLVGAVVALALPRAERVREVEDEHYVEALRRGARLAVRVPGLASCMLAVAVVGAVVDTTSEYGPLFLSDIGFDASSIAIIVAALVLGMAAGSAALDRVKLSSLSLSVALGLSGAALLIGMLTSDIVSVAAYGLAVVTAQMAWVVRSAELQHAIVGDLRATATSMAGFGQEIINVAALVMLGAFADATSRSTAFEVMAAIVMLVGIPLAVGAVRHRQAVDTEESGS